MAYNRFLPIWVVAPFIPSDDTMISDYLDRAYVLSETRAHRDSLAALHKRVLAKDKQALVDLKKHKVTTSELATAIAALTDALARAKKDKSHPQDSAYIPQDPVTCSLQTGMTRLAIEDGQVRVNTPDSAPARATRGKRGSRGTGGSHGKGTRGAVSAGVDTSPSLRLRTRAERGVPSKAARASRAPFVENSDPRYGLEGFRAKFGNLFIQRRAVQSEPRASLHLHAP